MVQYLDQLRSKLMNTKISLPCLSTSHYVTNSTLNTMHHKNAYVESIMLRALIKS